jgi:addiction module RelB/DinJ family antitoxin
MKTVKSDSVLVRARVPAERLRNAQRVLDKMGLKTSDAINVLMAQIELRQGLPFDMTLSVSETLAAEDQAAEWTEAFGAY